MPTAPDYSIREVNAKKGDLDAIWEFMLEPIFRAGETFCIPQDISKEDALAYWTGGSHRAFIAEAPVPTGGKSAVGTIYFSPCQIGNGAHVATCGFVTSAAWQGKGGNRFMKRGNGFEK